MINPQDRNWLLLKQEQAQRSQRHRETTPMQVHCVTRFWRDHGRDQFRVEFERGAIQFTESFTGRIPDAQRVLEQLQADRLIKHQDHKILFAVCKNPGIEDARCNVLEIQDRELSQCWVWLAEHWMTGDEQIRVWELPRMTVGKGVTQYWLNQK